MKMKTPGRFRHQVLGLALAGAGQAVRADTEEISRTCVGLGCEYPNMHVGSHGRTFPVGEFD